MPRYRDETKRWLDLAQAQERPYGHSYWDGVLLLSIVRRGDKTISEELNRTGFGHWRAVSETRPIKLSLTARMKRGRAQWDTSEKLADGAGYTVRLAIEQPHPEADYFPEDDESCVCVVIHRGEEVVETICPKTRQYLKSQFWAEIRQEEKESQEKKEMKKYNWLLAIAEGVKGIPGAEIIMGPLIRLRNDELEAERNDEIDKMFAENRTVSEATLNQVLNLDKDNREIRAMLQVAAPVLNAEFKRQRGEPVIMEISRFPLPFSKGLVIQELRALWPKSTDEIEVTLAENDYLPISTTNSGNYVIAFVDSMTGNDRGKLAAVFTSLSEKRRESKILQFAARYMSGPEHLTDRGGA